MIKMAVKFVPNYIYSPSSFGDYLEHMFGLWGLGLNTPQVDWGLSTLEFLPTPPPIWNSCFNLISCQYS